MSDQSIICIHADKMLKNFFKESLLGSPITVIRHCSTMKEAYDFYSKDQSPIIVIDTFLPGLSAFDILKGVRKMNANVAIILLARFRTKTFTERAFRMGASDILPLPMNKDIFLNIVLHRLRNVAEQEVVFNN